MRRRHVLIAYSDGDHRAAAAEELSHALVQHWTGAAIVECAPIDVGDRGVERDRLRRAGAVIALLGPLAGNRETLALIESAERLGTPVLVVLADGEHGHDGNTGTYAGAFALPISTPVAAMAASIDGLMHTSGELRRLREELSLAHRCHGGVEGEIVRMHDEMQLAAMVQRELLPRQLPEVHGVSFAAMWRPANYVSGDIYDIIRLDEDHVGVFLTDAVGHGVPAALMTMVISRSIVMKEITGDNYRILPPSDVLERLNTQMLLRQEHAGPGGPGGRFATAVYALINCRSRTMHVAGAGHPRPLLIHASGESTELDAGHGGLLGIFEDEQYDQIELELESGDQILFYSDGFERAFPTHSSDAYQRHLPSTRYRREFENIASGQGHRGHNIGNGVRAQAQSSVPRPHFPALFIQQLTHRLDAQLGSLHQVDDLTLICAHIGELASGVKSPKSEISGQRSVLRH